MHSEGDQAMTTAATPRARLRRRGWPLFIVLSLLLHLLLFVLLTRLMPAEPPATPTIAPIAVQLEVARTPEATAPAQGKSLPAAAPQPPVPPEPPPQQEVSAAPVTKPPADTVAPPAAAYNPWLHPEEFDDVEATGQRVLDEFPDAGAPMRRPPQVPDEGEAPDAEPNEGEPRDEESRLQIESLIRTRFADHFHYPPLAQRHGWQGEVVLTLRVATDGTLSAIEVVRSSGHAILDQAALDSLRAVERIEFTPGMSLRHQLELRMPVIYQLARR